MFLTTWPLNVAVFWKAAEPLDSGAMLEEVSHQEWTLRSYSQALIPPYSQLPVVQICEVGRSPTAGPTMNRCCHAFPTMVD